MMNTEPPKRMLDFLRWFCREDYLEEIEGDLVEIYRENFQKSPVKAKFILLGSGAGTTISLLLHG